MKHIVMGILIWLSMIASAVGAEQCREVYIERTQVNMGNAIIGTVIGALVGGQVLVNGSREVGTALGAIAGSQVGKRIDESRPRERVIICE